MGSHFGPTPPGATCFWILVIVDSRRACNDRWPSGIGKTAGSYHRRSLSTARMVFFLVLCRPLPDSQMVGRLGDHFGPALFGAVLIFLPLVAGKGERSPLRRPWSFVIVAFITLMIAYYGVVGHVAPWSPRMEAPPLPMQVVGADERTSRRWGESLSRQRLRILSHVSGYGGIRGPDLTYAGDTMTPAQMTTRIYSGGANMPSYNGNLTRSNYPRCSLS